MPKTKYGTAGAKLPAKYAQIFGSFLELKFPDGHYTPQQVVDAARPKSSPIHKMFEWDEKVAAEKFRVYQARNFINHLTVTLTNETRPSKGYYSVKLDDEREYVASAIVLDTPELRDQVVEQALNEAESWVLRYETYDRLKPICLAINKELRRWQNEQRRPKKSQRKPQSKKRKKQKSQSRRSTSASRK